MIKKKHIKLKKFKSKKQKDTMKFENCSSSDLYVLAEEIKKETFELDTFSINPYSFVCASAYDTAWLAMIEDLCGVNTQQPLFRGCIDWILSNQNVVEGLWGNHGDENEGETLTSTLACVVALRKWNIGSLHISKGDCFFCYCYAVSSFRFSLIIPFVLQVLDESIHILHTCIYLCFTCTCNSFFISATVNYMKKLLFV